jgi:hypothetical protein
LCSHGNTEAYTFYLLKEQKGGVIVPGRVRYRIHVKGHIPNLPSLPTNETPFLFNTKKVK